MPVSIEDLTKIRDYILLGYLLEMIRNSVERKQRDWGALNELALLVGNALHDRVYADYASIKKEFRLRGIKVWEDEHKDIIIYHGYVCEGFQDKFGIVKEVLKAEMSVKLGEYIKEMGDKMRGP